ncbi:Phosphatidylinositol 4-kinase PIK1, partial [Ceratocystis fimbriata CBS 114723]
MSWTLLQRFIESDVFNSNPFLPVSYLTRYADHIGINYVLCNKLRQFPYEDIEFFLPQICHLIISLDNESMALEEFLLDLCEESVTAALLTFWLFQTYLHDLSSNPQSDAFQTCRRVYNKVQHIVFGLPDAARYEKIRENILPVSVLSSFVLASVAVPILPQWAGPLAVAQARKPPKGEPAETREPTTITKSATTKPASPRSRRHGLPRVTSPSDSALTLSGTARRPSISESLALDTPGRETPTAPNNDNPSPTTTSRKPGERLELALKEARFSTSSLPLMGDLRSPQPPRPSTPLSASIAMSSGINALHRRHTHRDPFGKSRRTAIELSSIQKTRLLRQHYFRSETQFLTALENISNRLVAVPKPARLSALRAELALIAQDLPAEIDIPVICPPTLVNGSPGRSKHHRIVRINPAESTVLNSAEKVPFLLMIEILRDDFTFDPDTPDNERLLVKLMTESGSKKRIFDLSEAPRTPIVNTTQEPALDSVFEPTSGDLGTPQISGSFSDDVSGLFGNQRRIANSAANSVIAEIPATPQSSDNSTSGSSSPSRQKHAQPPPQLPVPVLRGHGVEPDFSALATHMRTASQMLAQLEITTRKRPKHEVEAIRAKIIASMQSLEEQSFDINDETGPTFDTIMAKSVVPSASDAPTDLDEEVEPTDTARGEARMENDFKTGGIQGKGDRDDPSAAVFGEAWQVKKARIQKSSPYGWMKNWDLVSVIIKTGADLRQEAFACQLISACDKIWVDAKIKVWVKVMKILVTGESSGLIETITNGVSVHSIKRSLTLAMEPSPKRRIATLKDHFVKVFGPPKSKAYKAGVDAFKRSLAAYSVISYVFQLKDRHNGNILIDSEGHIVHIDFGFMLSNSPGSMGFEAAPCKLTQEYVDVLGGLESKAFADYKKLCKQAFQALRRSADNIIDLVAMMAAESKMPCFAVGIGPVTSALRQRFQLQLSAEAAENFVETDIIGKSVGSYYTR